MFELVNWKEKKQKKKLHISFAHEQVYGFPNFMTQTETLLILCSQYKKEF